MSTILVVTSSQLPRPDPEAPLLAAALRAGGASADVVVWDDPRVDWAAAALVLIRSTWDYIDRVGEFVAWAQRTAGVTRLANPAEVVAWNAHKGYLLELERAGVPIVPTTLVRPGEDPLPALAAARAADVVVKPAVGAGAFEQARYATADAAAAEHLRSAGRDMLVQPFLPAVVEGGERSLLFFSGELSHAVSKHAASGDYRVQEHYGGTVVPHAAAPAELELARAALAQVDAELLYARVDLVEGARGPLLMELELIEPFLFLESAPESLDRLSRVVLEAAG